MNVACTSHPKRVRTPGKMKNNTWTGRKSRQQTMTIDDVISKTLLK